MLEFSSKVLGNYAVAAGIVATLNNRWYKEKASKAVRIAVIIACVIAGIAYAYFGILWTSEFIPRPKGLPDNARVSRIQPKSSILYIIGAIVIVVLQVAAFAAVVSIAKEQGGDNKEMGKFMRLFGLVIVSIFALLISPTGIMGLIPKVTVKN